MRSHSGGGSGLSSASTNSPLRSQGQPVLATKFGGQESSVMKSVVPAILHRRAPKAEGSRRAVAKCHGFGHGRPDVPRSDFVDEGPSEAPFVILEPKALLHDAAAEDDSVEPDICVLAKNLRQDIGSETVRDHRAASAFVIVDDMPNLVHDLLYDALPEELAREQEAEHIEIAVVGRLYDETFLLQRDLDPILPQRVITNTVNQHHYRFDVLPVRVVTPPGLVEADTVEKLRDLVLVRRAIWIISPAGTLFVLQSQQVFVTDLRVRVVGQRHERARPGFGVQPMHKFEIVQHDVERRASHMFQFAGDFDVNPTVVELGGDQNLAVCCDQFGALFPARAASPQVAMGLDDETGDQAGRR